MRLKRGVVVLHRGPGETQVGLARPVVLRGLTAADQNALAVLEGGRLSPASLSPAMRESLQRIASAGHEQCVPPAASTHRALTVAIHGAGAVGIAAARSLAQHGHAVEIVDSTPAVAESPGVFTSAQPRDTCAVAAAREVRAAVPAATVRVGVSQPQAAIAVGVGTADPVAWIPLLRSDVPHVLVATDELGVDVGPLVLPGVTACGQCLDLDKTAADPAWPHLRVQCGASRRPVVEPQAADSAGALAAAMLLAWAESLDAPHVPEPHPAAWAINSIWRVEAGRPPVVRPLWPQPDCGCGAAGAAATSERISAP